MRVMPEQELLSRLQHAFTPMGVAMETLVEFLDTNGFHDASRALAHRWDCEQPDPEPDGDFGSEVLIEKLSDALSAFVKAKNKDQLRDAREKAVAALQLAECE